MITVTTIPVLKDNYTYLVEVPNGDVLIVDPGEAEPVIKTLELLKLRPSFILNTHHHGDHTGGNAYLKARYGCQIIAPEAEKDRIKSADIYMHDGQEKAFGKETMKVIATPGHTAGGVCYYFRPAKILFTGDTLFSLGCGRLIEGTAEQMWESLQKIIALPDTVIVYCGHEYTEANGAFCLHVDPDNPDLHLRMAEVRASRSSGQPTVPVELGIEKKTNAFLRAGTSDRFAVLRQMKDQF